MKRLYVITRNDLGSAYQAVQGAHAVAKFVMDYPNNEWKNGYLIFLAVEDYHEIMEISGLLDYDNWGRHERKKIPISEYHEADLNNELTAIAIYTSGYNKNLRKLMIMGQDEGDRDSKQSA